jgi:hypothetical protein
MRHIPSKQRSVARAQPEPSTLAAAFLGVALLGLAMWAGAASVGVMAIALRGGVAPGAPEPSSVAIAGRDRPDSARFLSAAHWATRATVPAVRRQPSRAAVRETSVPAAAKVPVAEAVLSTGVLAALRTFEDEDTDAAPSGLGPRMATDAVAVALSGSSGLALTQERSGMNQRRGGDRLNAASIGELGTDGVGPVTYGEKTEVKIVLDEPETVLAANGPVAAGGA